MPLNPIFRMVDRTSEPQHLTYIRALQMISDQSRRELATLVPHLGERGRITEEIICSVLRGILPKRFSIGTGILISASGETSHQTDIVIFDNLHNSPILSEYGVGVYPVEIVYATLEVKSVLTKKDLDKTLSDIRLIRHIGSKKHYVVSELAIAEAGLQTRSRKITVTTPPRSYIIAFDQKGLGKNYHAFQNTLCTHLDKNNDHVHGVALLKDDWFAGRLANRNPAQIYGSQSDALLNLYRSILRGQQNFSVYPLDLDMYLNPT